MKNYDIHEHEDGKVISYMNGNRKISFGEHPDNSEYQEYLRYTAWVEAGNTPEDFWTQDDELEPSEPKEEEPTEQPSSTDTKIETDLGE